jgi:CheY-like chemotaxis protein
LKQLGFNCTAVTNGTLAGESALSDRFDLILMDCQMPEVDGFEATKAIREAENLLSRHTPIIGLTAHAMEGDRERCISAGMDDYLSKPTSLDKLSTTINRWLQEPKSNGADMVVANFAEEPDLETRLSDAMFAELLPVFITSTSSLIDALRTEVERCSYQKAQSIATEIESSGLSVGARRIALLCREFCRYAKVGSFESMKTLVEELTASLERLKNRAQVYRL